MRQRALAPTLLLLTTVLAACGGDDGNDADTAPGQPDVAAVVAGEPFPDDRCDANRAAGTITYLTGFDYAAAASIVEVITADANGYYDAVCLDVEIRPSFSTDNYPLVSGGEGDFASGGSFSEVVNYAAANNADLVAVTVAGRSPIDTLMVKPGVADTLADLEGTTIGVKGRMGTSIEVMLASNGVDVDSIETVMLEGFDPVAHMSLPDIDGVPGWKSNEPGRLEREGIEFDQFVPSDYDVPGSFGAIFTTREFVEQHPTATEDFVRATLHGLETAIADPAAASAAAIALVEASGNPMFLSPEGEAFRWETEAELIASHTPDGVVAGSPDVEVLTTEVETYAETGLFGDGVTPAAGDRIDADVAAAVTADGQVIWPSG